MTDRVDPGTNRFPFYLGAVGTSSMAMGLQTVLFPWIVVGVLGEDAHRLGLAQMAVMIPNLLFILVGGALSDSRHLGTHLGRLYLLYALPLGLIITLAFSEQLAYWQLLVYGVVYGMITAFVQPARESLLPQLTRQVLQTAVAKSALVQFGAQSLGISAAGLLGYIELPQLLALQLLLFVVTSQLVRRSQPRGEGFVPPERAVREVKIFEGVKLVLGHKRLLPLMILVGTTGFFGIGAYMVAMPLLARTVYQQGAGFFAMMQLCFVAGIMIANLILMRWVGSLQRPGRMMLVSLLLRGVLICILALQVPAWLLFPVLVVWGILSGVSMTLGRSMTHEEAPPHLRSRVVSVYQLCLFGAAPLGAWMAGFAIDSYGISAALLLLGTLTFVVTGASALFSGLWQQRRETQSVQPSPPR